MRLRNLVPTAFLGFGCVAIACGGDDFAATPGSGGGGFQTDAGADTSLPSDGSAAGSFFDVATSDTTSSPDGQVLTIVPEAPTVTVETGKPVPTLTFEAKVNGATVAAKWLIDRGEIGTIGLQTGLFTPSGSVGGVAKVTATIGAGEVSTPVTVNLVMEQNGAAAGDAGSGFGGWGGVGGEGPGVSIDDPLKAILTGPPSADASLKWLYPYDKTTWPLGTLAPLLQWTPTAAPIDAIYIHLTGKSYEYKGYFGRPPALPAGAPFVHHPIPQDVWKAALTSCAGGTLTASVVVASGGAAWGPITQTWNVASGPLKGTVYYQSYGTSLAKNYEGGMGGDGLFGGATLAIKGGSSDPTLVAGSNGGHDACRVCHTVSLDGSRMIVQQGLDYGASSSYALNGAYAETPYGAGDIGKFGWIGMYPDGSIGLSNGAPLHAKELPASQLYDMATAAVVPSVGLDTFVTKAGFPAFSPDGKHVAFSLYTGAGTAETGPGDGSQLVAMDFDRTTNTFSNPKLLYKAPADKAPGWVSFLPTNDAVVFAVQSRTNNANEFMMTRYGARGELYWSDLATGTAHSLDMANGKEAGVSYLPSGANAHDDDTTLQYEPTINPVVSGGYAWVVFMSRRMYGNVATIDPWWSDPREHDLTVAPTPKKLWVAAIDLNAPAGTDPSHPAFYLPAQELYAGNTRGFWVVDPCKSDGNACESGDECCGGYCQYNADAGGLICSNHKTECSNEYEKCEVASDCCDALNGMLCINGRCAKPAPPK